MMQFYFLSVFFNGYTGLMLTFNLGNTLEIDKNKNNTRLLVIGLMTLFTGVIKLLSVSQPDIIILGDLLPVVAGISGGLCLLFTYYINTSTIEYTPSFFVETVFLKGQKYIGVLCLAASLLHFLFPKVRIL